MAEPSIAERDIGYQLGFKKLEDLCEKRGIGDLNWHNGGDDAYDTMLLCFKRAAEAQNAG